MDDAAGRSPSGSTSPQGNPLERDHGVAEIAGALDDVLVDAKLSVPLPRPGVVSRAAID